jgi:hypothetical protein
MHLSAKEVERFYNIWFPLLYYVNQRRQLVEAFPATWGDASVAPEVAAPIRDALWEDDTLREGFIADNPAGLSQDDLALVESWKYRVTDNFFIFRHLRKYTVFLSGDSPTRGYGVLGLTGSIEEVVGSYLPLYARTALLPFEGRIIYDSLVSVYSIHFGSGSRSGLNNTYRAIQERAGIITTLPPDTGSNLDRVRGGNKRVLSAFQKSLGQSGLSPQKMQEHIDNVSDFAYDFLLSQEPPGLLLDVTRQDIETFISETGEVNLVSFKRFVRFLRDTDRMDWDQAQDLLDYLKRQQRR